MHANIGDSYDFMRFYVIAMLAAFYKKQTFSLTAVFAFIKSNRSFGGMEKAEVEAGTTVDTECREVPTRRDFISCLDL